MISTIHCYIFKEWLKTLCVALLLILGILILEDMYRNLKTFIEQDASFQTIVSYYIFVVPNCLCTVLPISFFISVLYTLNNMQAHNEIVALRASGMTIFFITRSLWCAAILLMVLMGLLNAYVLPYASNQMQLILQKIDYDVQKKHGGQADQIGVQYHLGFHNVNKGYLWHCNRFSMYTHKGDFTTLSLVDSSGHETERVEADKVIYENKQWHFINGKHWYFDRSTLSPTHFSKFKEWSLQGEKSPEFMVSVHKPLKHLGVHELKSIIQFYPEDHPRYLEHRIKYYSLISSPLICWMVVLLAIPFSLSGVRTNPMVGVSKAVGLFFSYYIICNIGKMLGIQRILTPLIAAWFPNLLMLILGCFLYKKLAPR